ncbi:MAG: aromatic aminobenezylarsenical efflux permease ArsG family transporter [Patescibacteria group bacterium]|nr:sulfite exporter TauE/SafE family protein [Patescibacteria group bacterium]MBU1876909.1 sulfite exporter TauE/SafE family protein [Patescibacteria group bacterium]
MTDFINYLIDSYNIPLLNAFLLGVLASISPCPLATNITAIAYISKEVKTIKNTLLNGLFYAIGRGISYTLLAVLIYFGLSSFEISRIFQGWGDKILGPILIIIGLIMFGFIKINFSIKNKRIENIKEWLTTKGYVGSLLLGVLFALAFCPYSGVLFFGVLIPLVLKSSEGLLLAPLFAFGTGLPVIVFSFLIAFSVQKINKLFGIIQEAEKAIRYIVALIFIITGFYHLQFLFKYLIVLLNRF